MPPDDQKMTESTPVEPVHVTVVGVGATDAKFLPSGTVATTPGSAQPDVIVNVVQPIVAVSVRFGNLFGTTLVGLLVAAMTPAGGKLLYTGDFLHMVATCANLSLPVAALGFFKDLVTLFGRLENKYPLLTGKV
jgi:hypothetical protein